MSTATAAPTDALVEKAETAETLDLRSLVLAADDIVTEPVEVPEWKVTLHVRTMTGSARADMLNAASDPETGQMDFKSMYPNIIVATVVNPDTGVPIFTPADVDLLNQKSGKALERVAQAGMKISGMGEEAEKALGNDSSAESGGSTSS